MSEFGLTRYPCLTFETFSFKIVETKGEQHFVERLRSILSWRNLKDLKKLFPHQLMGEKKNI